MSRYPGEFMPSELFLSNNGVKTFEHDEKLPSLPVPDLNSTLDKYVESVTPHLDPNELQRTRRVVEEFRRNEGPGLQRLLQDRAEHRRNWLDEWWLSHAYLRLRLPIAPLINVCGTAPYLYHYWPPTAGTQIRRNAISLRMVLEHWQHMRREDLVPDSGRSGKEPWSMSQFRYLYNSCRAPGLEEDKLHNYFKTETEGTAPAHLVVFCNRRIYKIDGVLNTQGDICTPPQLEQVLRQIKTDAYKKPPGLGLAALTSENRTVWYHQRERLISLSPVNKENLEIIQSAIIGNSLVEASPTTQTQMTQEGLLGGSGNVWFDKSYSSVWYANGTSVSNCDHSPMDAMTSIHVCFYADNRVFEMEGVWQGSPGRASDVPTFRELEFVVDEQIIGAIKTAERNFHMIASNVELINTEFNLFGKDLLRELKLHPDTFVQVCLQYAYYKMYGRPAPTYETATTRKFYKGRTETVRSCTNEALLFAKAMLDPKAHDSHKIQLFRQAMSKHLTTMRECMSGEGIDRHLLGLKIIASENGMTTPQIFTDPAFEKSGGNGNFILSTSFIGFTSVHGTVVPMCTNGYGFFYGMRGSRMIISATSWISDKETSAIRLYETVKGCMIEIVELLTHHPVSAM